MIKRYRYPFRFYFLSAVLAWLFWLAAAWFSHHPEISYSRLLVSTAGLVGLSMPLLVAYYYIAKDRSVRADVTRRFFNFSPTINRYVVIAVVLMPASILLAMAISLLLGYDVRQFVITGHATFTSGVFPVWFMLISAPILEELAWHTYGTDCLRQKYSLFTTSCIFAIYWALWHVPLALIQGYYHSNLVNQGMVHSINFLVSIFPFALLMNWLYYKTDRNVLVAVVFHLNANVFNEIFATHPDSKVIQTALLTALVIYLLYKDRKYFFDSVAPAGGKGWLLLSGILLLTLSSTSNADSLLPERRKNQFPTDSGHLLAPLPYSIPAIGEGLFLLANFSNAFATTADPSIIEITGDARGRAVLVEELPLLPQHLFLRAKKMNISTVAVNNYDNRGMRTRKNDYSLLEFAKYGSDTLGLDLTFWQRQLNFSLDQSREKGSLNTIRDAKGVVINDFSKDPFVYKNQFTRWGLQLDMTDDYLDARKGLRVDFRYQDVPPSATNDPDYFVTEINASLFLPALRNNTLVINYYQSDANIRKRGNTDPAAISSELGFHCPPADSQCQDTEAKLVDKFVAQRRYGTASSLGGDNRFRAYPQGRFDGAHVQFLGAEYRWNFVHDATPFDYFIWKDTHSGVQLAFFGEYATVAETRNDLWDDARLVLGSGLRLVTTSGSIYRADLAVGDEGPALNLFFFYPWK